MADPIKVANSAAQLENRTLVTAEDEQEISGLKRFYRAPNAPFGVEAASAVVANLDADLLDGEHGSDYHDASKLAAGTVPAARFPNPLPAVSGENLYNLDAAQLTGVIPATSVPNPLPAVSGVNLTAMPATLPVTSLANATDVPAAELSGTVPDANVPAYAKNFTLGGPILYPPATQDILVWIATFACRASKLRGRRTGGTAVSVNARRNGTDTHLSSALALTNDGEIYDGGALQYTDYAVGDRMEIQITALTGAPSEVYIQVDLVPIPA
jgi:hypothetical protein